MAEWLMYALLSMVFAGVTAVIAKHGLEGISADTGIAVRTIVIFAFVMVNAFVMRTTNEFATISMRSVLFLALSGITTSISWICYYRAIKIGNVSEVALVDKGSIIITLALSFIILREPATPKVLLGAAFVGVGLVILAWR